MSTNHPHIRDRFSTTPQVSELQSDPVRNGGVFSATAKEQGAALDDKVVTVSRSVDQMRPGKATPPLPRKSLVGEDARKMARDGGATFHAKVGMISGELDKL